MNARPPALSLESFREAQSHEWDVIVIGGGNAALVSALAARHLTGRVLLLERSTQVMRGGNTRHTRNVRCMHNDSDPFSAGVYSYDELWSDLCGVGSGPTDEELASRTVAESESVPRWMSDHGIRWQPPLTGTLHLSRTNRFFLGGGKALVNAYFAHAADMGVQVCYDTRVDDLRIDGDRAVAVVVSHDGGNYELRTRSVVCASGGFEANLDWLRRYWGDAVDNYLIRGPQTNDGRVLAALFRHGAATAGEERGFHAVAVDARAPRFDGGIATRLDTIPFGIVVNSQEQRFYDEGEDLWPKRYASWGRNIAEQNDQIAYCIWDSKVNKQFLPPMYGAFRSDSLDELASLLGLDRVRLEETVREFNDACQGGQFDPQRLDGCATAGIHPPKSHWAQRIDAPPYYGIPMRPGITFTYMGVQINALGQVLREDGTPFTNVFAAGEIMSGNVLSTGYLAGFGLTIGTVWGRIAGEGAARVD